MANLRTPTITRVSSTKGGEGEGIADENFR